MRLNACGSKVLVLLVLSAAAGCEGNRTVVAPTSPTPPPAGTVSVRVEGRVIDGDRDDPVPGAVVTVDRCSPGGCLAYLADWTAPNATADDQGVFVLTVNIPQAWRGLFLHVTRDGYEPTRVYVAPAAATAAVLRLLRTFTIRSGESIETRVFVGTHSCGGESTWACRRFFVESPSGESMDIEVIPAEGQVVTLVVGPEQTHPDVVSIQRRVTVSGGEVWIYAVPGRVTLTAHRR